MATQKDFQRIKLGLKSKLTKREKVVLASYAKDLTTAEISILLSISEKTVSNLAYNARHTLRTQTTTGAVVRALINGDIKL